MASSVVRGCLSTGSPFWLALCRKNLFGRKSWHLISPSSTAFLQPQRTYRAALCTELKEPLVVKDIPSPLLQPHEVRIRVCCCGVNFADTLACQGLYQERPSLPFTPEIIYQRDKSRLGAMSWPEARLPWIQKIGFLQGPLETGSHHLLSNLPYKGKVGDWSEVVQAHLFE